MSGEQKAGKASFMQRVRGFLAHIGRRKLRPALEKMATSGALRLPGMPSQPKGYVFFGDMQEYIIQSGIRNNVLNRLFCITPAVFGDRTLPFFIHIPRCASVAVSGALYNGHRDHHPARFFQSYDKAAYDRLDSFTVIRDPVRRALSGFTHVIRGGSADMPLLPEWAARTAHIRTLDDYIAFLEENAANLYELDFVMRPQADYVTDAAGQIIVRRIFRLEKDYAALEAFLAPLVSSPLRRSNESKQSVTPTEQQTARLRALYSRDVTLYDTISAAPQAAVTGRCHLL